MAQHRSHPHRGWSITFHVSDAGQTDNLCLSITYGNEISGMLPFRVGEGFALATPSLLAGSG